MQIQLENVGIVKNSTLNLDGLTVITGKNNSGKTTVGKILYAILEGAYDIRRRAERDKYEYTIKQLGNIRDKLDVLQYVYFVWVRHLSAEDALDNYLALKSLCGGNYLREIPRQGIEKFAHEVESELSSFDSSLLLGEKWKTRFRNVVVGAGNDEKTLVDIFIKQRDESILILKKLFIDLGKDLELIDYTYESINQTMRTEFANQIQPIKLPDVESKVRLSSEDSVFCDLKIIANNVVNEKSPIFIGSPHKNAYLIDDAFVLDGVLPTVELFSGIEYSGRETYLNLSHINSHREKLRRTLGNGRKVNVFEQTVRDKALERVKQQIDNIIPGAFEFTPEGNYYVRDGVKLKMCNLATGSKMFSIIKILLERGELNNTTMLILDEPEAHLHPQWQNTFAEMIVLLVKELNVNVVLTTHSPNFMLAIDAYMRKYEINDKSNFYQTEEIEDGFVQYQCVNDNLSKIYQDFLEYLSEVKILRNKYAHGIGD